MTKDAMFLTTGEDEDLNNLGTFKGFTCGYPELKIPSTWVPSSFNLTLTQGRSRVQFKLYEIKTPDRGGNFYVITGVLKGNPLASEGLCSFWRYLPKPKYVPTECKLAGFWEVVPSNMYPSLLSLEMDVASRHKATDFELSHDTFLYKTNTGEILELFKDAGETRASGIAGIISPNGTRLQLKDYHINT
jgi:hypothetical protein